MDERFETWKNKIIGFGMAIKSFGLASIFSRKGVEKWRENMLWYIRGRVASMWCKENQKDKAR